MLVEIVRTVTDEGAEIAVTATRAWRPRHAALRRNQWNLRRR